jgi:hypothetical protein
MAKADTRPTFYEGRSTDCAKREWPVGGENGIVLSDRLRHCCLMGPRFTITRRRVKAECFWTKFIFRGAETKALLDR